MICRSTKSLRAYVPRVTIVAHKEDVSGLVDTLVRQGFEVDVQRAEYSADELRHSASVRCLLNHAAAWRKVANSGKPSIVVEADFVPCREFAHLPLPFAADDGRDEQKFAWLYSCGSVLYGQDADGALFGHGNTTVAYLLTPSTAASLEEFACRESTIEPGSYSSWETRLGIFLRKERGVLNYLPLYQYGEHGGLPNPEHRRAGIRSWHEADVLWGALAFRPLYARNSVFRYWTVRARGWLRGCLRLVTLRYFNPRHVNPATQRGRFRMASVSCLRLVKLA
jgi:hypothetical protein